MKKIVVSTFSILFSLTTYIAQSQVIELFPKGFINENKTYTEEHSTEVYAGHEAQRLTNVGTPTIKIYKAATKAKNGKTIIVSPGGGYNILSTDKEGSEVCEFLNKHGYDAALLTYRVPRREGREKHEAALEDLQRAISIIRKNGAEYGIDNSEIGVIGFSAGAHLSVMASTNDRIYDRIDEIDDISCRPDFCALVYPAYLSGENFGVAEDIKISSSIPKTFIAQSEDDKNFINSSIFYYYALKEAKVPVTMHLYSNGGHGHGMRKTGKEADQWSERYIDWLDSLNK
ncbi:MAG: alpha/beta hydrolase [Rikenellaceae bacterium]